MISNCVLTRSDTSIIRPWYVASNYFVRRVGIHTGVDVTAESVYALCDGTVMYVGTDPDRKHKVVVIQYDANSVFRYCNLSSVAVTAGTEVVIGQLVGTADHFVHFEALQLDPPEMQFRVDIYNRNYYKIDPTPYVDGTIQLTSPTAYDPYKYQFK